MAYNEVGTIHQPEDLKVNLYPHQLCSIYQMEKREHEKQVIENNIIFDTNIGVNADATGYGKTLSMVTLVLRDKMEWDITTPFSLSIISTFALGKIKKTIEIGYEKIDATLVLVSPSIILQWYEEFKKTPLCIKMITTKKHVDTVLLSNYDVILVTPTMYNKLICKHSKLAWKRFIFDEPGHLRVPAMGKIVAGFNWLVTATPDSIVSKHRSCRNSFMYDIIGCCGNMSFSEAFSYLIIKNTDEFIIHSFSMPPTHHHYYQCYNPIYNTLKGLVSSNISQMISAGNIGGAIKALGGGTTNNITELVKQKKTLELEELESRLRIITIRNDKIQIDILLAKSNRLKDQIKELDNRFNTILTGDCNICLDKISKPVMEPNCQNIFCGNCILKWLENKDSCPLCREQVKINELIYIDDGTIIENKPHFDIRELQTKVNTVISLLKSKQEGKFIIFSEWDQTFVPIRNCLYENSIEFIEVKGGASIRQKNIESFN